MKNEIKDFNAIGLLCEEINNKIDIAINKKDLIKIKKLNECKRKMILQYFKNINNDANNKIANDILKDILKNNLLNDRRQYDFEDLINAYEINERCADLLFYMIYNECKK